MADGGLTETEKIALGAAMRWATRFDGLGAEERARAIAAAAEELGLVSTERRMVANPRAGFRDAAMVMEVVSSELDPLMAAASALDSSGVRAILTAVDRTEVRVAIAAAVESLARH